MPVRRPEISSSVVILLGNFNPKIFQPEWFARQQLISSAEADAADIKIILPQISHFETDRFGIQVTTDRFTALTPPSASSAPLRDLVQGTFFVLEHTPVTATGLNRQMHFPIDSEAQWHKLGDKLAPKDGWKGVLPGSETENSREVMQEQAVAAGDYRIASWAQRTASEDTRTARGPSQKTQTDLTGAASGTSSQVSGPTYHARLRFREPNLVPERIDAAQLPN